MRRRAVLLCVSQGFLLAACDNAPVDTPADAVRQRLVGTWLRDYEDQGTRVRRILVLEQQGRFQEMSVVTGVGAAAVTESRGEGEWMFDGTNLKRHYRSINGKPVAAPIMPYATFELSFPSKTEFVGIDHVHKREVRYERVPDGTLP